MLGTPAQKIKQESGSVTVDFSPSSNLSIDEKLLKEINTNSVESSNFDLLDGDYGHFSPQTPSANETPASRQLAAAAGAASIGRPGRLATSRGARRVNKCFACEKCFNNSSALAKHKHTHSDERKYVCVVCSKGFKRQDHLNGHMMTHRSKKPFQCQFSSCSKSYCDARSLRRHVQNHHHDQRQLFGANAGNADLQTLKRDTEKPRSRSPVRMDELRGATEQLTCSIKCEKCWKRFKTMSALNGHMRLHGGYVKKSPGFTESREQTSNSIPPFSSSADGSGGAGMTVLWKMLMSHHSEDQTVKTQSFVTSVDAELLHRHRELESLQMKNLDPAKEDEEGEDVSSKMGPSSAELTLASPSSLLAQSLDSAENQISVDILDMNAVTELSFDGTGTGTAAYYPDGRYAPSEPSSIMQNASDCIADVPSAPQIFNFENLGSQQDQDGYNPLVSPVSHTSSSLPNTPCDVSAVILEQHSDVPNQVDQASPNYLQQIAQDGTPVSQQRLHSQADCLTDALRLDTAAGIGPACSQQAEAAANQFRENCSASERIARGESNHQSEAEQVIQMMPAPLELSASSTPHSNTPSYPLTPSSNTPSYPLTPSSNTPSYPLTPSSNIPYPLTPQSNAPSYPLTPHYDPPICPLLSQFNTPYPVSPHSNTASYPLTPNAHNQSEQQSPQGQAPSQPLAFHLQQQNSRQQLLSDGTGNYRSTNTSFNFPPILTTELTALEYINPGDFSPPLTADDIIDAATVLTQQERQSLTDNDGSFDSANPSEPPIALQPPPKRNRVHNGTTKFFEQGKMPSDKWESCNKSQGAVPVEDYFGQDVKSKSCENLESFISESSLGFDPRSAKLLEYEDKTVKTSTSRKLKHRPDPIVIPKNIFSYSQLRSPRSYGSLCSSKCSTFMSSPYTPPPMLSPVRSGSGLFCSLIFSQNPPTPYSVPTSSSVCLLSSNDESVQKDSGAVPETDVQPHVNIGSDYQASIPLCCASEQTSASREQLLWHPDTTQELTDEDVQHYQDFACTAAVPGNGMNKEFALHLLHQTKGNISFALLQLMKGAPLLAVPHCLTQYKYQESEIWSRQEIQAYQRALLLHDKDFFCISKDVGSKSVKDCIQFYYLWKKVCGEEYKRLRALRKQREICATLPDGLLPTFECC